MNTLSISPATMTVSEAAILLGISRSNAYECVRLGSIPSIRLGRRIVVPTHAINALLASVTPNVVDNGSIER
ncbi:helix-turn-helix domain-containing protein [Ilumatobacter sp.]|uniref:helix-turn-helix domain-containing protein n=1 Tax=Ilumatobacter sp. TaxID=1967498 RepID=UPI0037505782